MHLATNIPFGRQKLQLAEADTSGSIGAHTDLILNSLRHRYVEGVSLVTDFGGRPGVSETDPDNSFCDLVSEFGGGRVRRAEIAQIGPHVWLTKMPLGLQYAQMRDAATFQTGPTCSLVHAVNLPSLMAAHLTSWCLQEPYDAFVVTSTAAEHAFLETIYQTGCLLKQRFGIQDLPNAPIVVKIPFGVDPSEYIATDKTLARKILGLPADKIYLLYFGRLDAKYKADLAPLLQAIQSIRRTHSEVHLIVAGYDPSGLASKRLSMIAKHMGIDHALTIARNVSPPLKKLLYSAADIFVSPVDNIQESFGLTLLEAMSMQLPIVASDWSGYRDIVDDGKSGLLVRTTWSASVEAQANVLGPAAYVADLEGMVAEQTIVDVRDMTAKIQTMVLNHEFRKTCGLEGRRRVQALFSWPRICASFAELWEQQYDAYAKDRENLGPAIKHLRYGDIFAGYASQRSVDNSNRVVYQTQRGQNWFARGIPKLEMPANGGIKSESIRRVLTLTQHPLTVREITAACKDPELAALAWLQKTNALILEVPEIHELKRYI